MFKNLKNHFADIKFCCALLALFFCGEINFGANFITVGASQAVAQIDVVNSDLSREIEKSLLFDKETREKFDVYDSEYGSNKVPNPTLGSLPDEEEKKEYSPEEMNIVLVDKVKIDKDIREKEKLAYNAVLVGQYEIALELYKEVLKKEPKNNYAKYSMAVVYQRLNQFKQAKNIYHELLKADVENKDEVIGNIIAIMIEESPREAIYLLNRLTKQNPDASFLLASMGLAYERVSDFDSAILYYNKALDEDSKNVNYSYNLGVLYDQKKDYEKAVEMYGMVIKNFNPSVNSDISLDSVKRRIDKIKQLI